MRIQPTFLATCHLLKTFRASERGGGTWDNFCLVCAAASQSPYPIIVYSVANYRPILVTFGQICNFLDPNLVTFYFYELTPFCRLNEELFSFHLQYKHSGTFANRKYEKLSYPKNPKMCDPIVVPLLKMRPHYSQSSSENATPSSGTSPLASY